VRPGKRVVLAIAPGGQPFGASFAAARPDVTCVEGTPSLARGAGRVRAVVVNGQELGCDLLVIDAPRAPAYELCAQAGAELTHEAGGFRVRASDAGRIREGVFACGEVVGTPLDPGALERAASALAESLPSPP
jgi:hypothetical protein